jgi:hypothetical protein
VSQATLKNSPKQIKMSVIIGGRRPYKSMILRFELSRDKIFREEKSPNSCNSNAKESSSISRMAENSIQKDASFN